jgi:hypothetical protein
MMYLFFVRHKDKKESDKVTKVTLRLATLAQGIAEVTEVTRGSTSSQCRRGRKFSAPVSGLVQHCHEGARADNFLHLFLTPVHYISKKSLLLHPQFSKQVEIKRKEVFL